MSVVSPDRTSSLLSSDSMLLHGNQPMESRKFELDRTMGSKVIDLLSRYLGRVGGIARLDIVVVE